MKVIFLTYSQSPYRVDFFDELSKYVDLTVCYEVKKDDDAKKNNRNSTWYGNINNNYKSIFLKNKRIFKMNISFDMIKLIKKNKYDIIVIGGYSSLTAMFTMEYLKNKKIPFILNTDGGFIKYNENKIKYFIKRYFIGMADYYLSTGENANKYLMFYGAKESYIYTYPFSSLKQNEILNKRVSKNDKILIRHELNINNKLTFISIGRFIEIKGFDILLKSIGQIKDAQFYIIGDKPKEEYMNIIESNKLDNVYFIDFMKKDKILMYLQASDVFILPTRGDIWGLVINEALASGLPVITTNKCGAGLELIKDNYNGFIIDVNSVSDLNNKIDFFINNQNKISIMSNNALKSIQKYSIENMALNHYEIFKEILKNDSRKLRK